MLTFPMLWRSSFQVNYTDDFNRANSDTVGAGWTEANAASWLIASNAVSCGGLGSWERACYRAGTSWGNGYVRCTPSFPDIGPALRLPAAGFGAGYMASYVAGDVRLYRWGSGQWEQIAATAVSPDTGNPIRLEASGSDLTVMTDTGSGWATRISTSDTRWGSAGHPGIAVSTNVADTRNADDFEEGF